MRRGRARRAEASSTALPSTFATPFVNEVLRPYLPLPDVKSAASN